MFRRGSALVVALAALWGAAAAHAGTYEVTACGSDLVNRAWTYERYNMLGRELSDPGTFVTSADLARCGAEDGISVVSRDETGVKRTVRAGEGAAFVFRAPAGTSVRSIQLWRNAVVRESTDDPATPLAEDGVWTYVARLGDAFPPAGAIAGETCPGNVHNGAGGYCRRGDAPLSSVVPVVYPVGASVVAVGIECQGEASKACFTNTGAVGQGNAGLNFERAIVTVDDPVAPSVGVADAAWRRPGDPVVVTAADASGVSLVRVSLDGADRLSAPSVCDFRLAAPCPVTVSPTLALTGVADGRHTLAVRAVDTAGNLALAGAAVDVDGTAPVISSVALSGRSVSAVVGDALSGVAGGELAVRTGADGAYAALPTTVRGGRLVATVPSAISRSRLGIRVSVNDRAGNVVAGAASSLSLATRVAGSSRTRTVRAARAVVPYGRSVRVSGRLALTDGSPLGFQPIAVTATARVTGARPRTLADLRTDASGRFSFVVGAGPSRDLRIAFPGADGFLSRTRALSLRVPASSSIRAAAHTLSGAGTLRFSGRLRTRGASVPPGGKIVELQARQGGRWSTVATTRARPSWHAVARFRGTPGRYPIRLRIRREAAFGYELGYSPSVVVAVR